MLEAQLEMRQVKGRTPLLYQLLWWALWRAYPSWGKEGPRNKNIEVQPLKRVQITSWLRSRSRLWMPPCLWVHLLAQKSLQTLHDANFLTLWSRKSKAHLNKPTSCDRCLSQTMAGPQAPRLLGPCELSACRPWSVVPKMYFKQLKVPKPQTEPKGKLTEIWGSKPKHAKW